MKITINYKVKKVNDEQTIAPNIKIRSWRKKTKRNVQVRFIEGDNFLISIDDEMK